MIILKNHSNKYSRHYFKLTFTRRYHPPSRTKKSYNPTIAGCWDWDKKEITVYLAGFKKSGYNSDSDSTREEMIRVLVHEVLHGVIDYTIYNDGIYRKGINHEWPIDNGMEYDSSLDK